MCSIMGYCGSNANLDIFKKVLTGRLQEVGRQPYHRYRKWFSWISQTCHYGAFPFRHAAV